MSAVTATFMLVRRATVLATPAPARVRADLARHDDAVRGTMAATAKNATVSRDGVLAASARERTALAKARAVSAEINDASGRLNALIIGRRRRTESVWRRWFPDASADDTIDEMRRLRDRLHARYAIANGARLRAEIAANKARSDHARATAQAIRDRDAAARATLQHEAIFAIVRWLLSAIPALAYVGARGILAMATRIEQSRELGYDPGHVVPPL